MAGAVWGADVASTSVAQVSRSSLGMSWWGLCSAMFYLFMAASLAMRYGSINAIIGMVLAAAVLAALSVPFVKYAGRTRHSSADVSSLVFGRKGAAIAPFLLFSTGLYFATFEGSVLAMTVTKALPFMSYGVACTLVVLCCTPCMARGAQQALARLNAVLFPVYMAGLAALFSLSLSKGSHDNWRHLGPVAVSMGWWPCFIYYLSQLILLMVMIDFARLARSADLRYHALVTFGAPFYLVAFLVNGLVGIFLAGALGISSPSETVIIDSTLAQLGALGGLAFVAATQMRINAVNYFVAAANLRGLAASIDGGRIPQSVWPALVAGAALALLRWTDAFGWLLSGSLYLGVLSASWVGVALTHVSVSAAGSDSADVNDAPAFRVAGIAAWVGGVVVGLAMIRSRSLTSFALVAAFLVACSLNFPFRARFAGRSAA